MTTPTSLPGLLYAMCAPFLRGYIEHYNPKPPKQYNGAARHPGIRNSKIAANVNMMHEKWLAESFPSRHLSKHKPERNPLSLSSIKMRAGVTRAQARLMRSRMDF